MWEGFYFSTDMMVLNFLYFLPLYPFNSMSLRVTSTLKEELEQESDFLPFNKDSPIYKWMIFQSADARSKNDELKLSDESRSCDVTLNNNEDAAMIYKSFTTLSSSPSSPRTPTTISEHLMSPSHSKLVLPSLMKTQKHLLNIQKVILYTILNVKLLYLHHIHTYRKSSCGNQRPKGFNMKTGNFRRK